MQALKRLFLKTVPMPHFRAQGLQQRNMAVEIISARGGAGAPSLMPQFAPQAGQDHAGGIWFGHVMGRTAERQEGP